MHVGDLHLDLATHLAKQRVSWRLEEAEHDRLAGRACGALRQRRQPRRLTRTLRAWAPQAVHQHASAR
jgi:hypothetical protein